jgi:hypothetical protein
VNDWVGRDFQAGSCADVKVVFQKDGEYLFETQLDMIDHSHEDVGGVLFDDGDDGEND